MPIFILTDDNIDAAKAALRVALPAIRSAHLTEAIAAGLGFQTHAALRAALASDTGKPPAVADAASSMFTKRLAELGYDGVPTHSFEVATTEKVLGDTPYTFFKQGDRVANDRHFHACQARNRPMVMVKMARQYAKLEWDCITIDSDCDDHVSSSASNGLVRVMFALFQEHAKGAPGKPLFYGKAFTGTVSKLLPDTARQLAEEYFKLLYLPLRDLPAPRRRAA
ncbi:hypothetical protein DBR17_02815 [Sphingomonas sp. HMWF008]|nr:hypothetical protein DBR17_02815 [Sphingomonas sp. HMWF008]